MYLAACGRKMSWNLVESWSWNFTLSCWYPCDWVCVHKKEQFDPVLSSTRLPFNACNLIIVSNERRSIWIYVCTKPAKYKYASAKLYRQYCYPKYYLFFPHFTSLQNSVPLKSLWMSPGLHKCKHCVWLAITANPPPLTSCFMIFDWLKSVLPGLNWARKKTVNFLPGL